MLCVVAVKTLVAQVAVRMLPLPASATAEQPLIEVAPSLKLTEPVGAVPDTLAVNVTVEPKFDGLGELASVVVDDDWLTLPVATVTLSELDEAEPTVIVMPYVLSI